MSKYKWYRKWVGGYWVYFKSCATGTEWRKVSRESYDYYKESEGMPAENYT